MSHKLVSTKFTELFTDEFSNGRVKIIVCKAINDSIYKIVKYRKSNYNAWTLCDIQYLSKNAYQMYASEMAF
jgi:hypothetical protein